MQAIPPFRAQAEPVGVIDAQAAADVEVGRVEALGADLAHEAEHDVRGVAENVHLGDGGAQVAVHARQLQQRLSPNPLQEPLHAQQEGTPQLFEPAGTLRLARKPSRLVNPFMQDGSPLVD